MECAREQRKCAGDRACTRARPHEDSGQCAHQVVGLATACAHTPGVLQGAVAPPGDSPGGTWAQIAGSDGGNSSRSNSAGRRTEGPSNLRYRFLLHLLRGYYVSGPVFDGNSSYVPLEVGGNGVFLNTFASH